MSMLIELGKSATINKGLFSIVDDEDHEELNSFNWNAHWCAKTSSYYAIRSGPYPKRRRITMHGTVMSPLKGMVVDHINHDTLDNRKDNLRVCTNMENQGNSRPRKGGTSPFKGVAWCKRERKWHASIRINKTKKFLGYYLDEIEAAKAYDTAAKEYFGEFAYLNLGGVR